MYSAYMRFIIIQVTLQLSLPYPGLWASPLLPLPRCGVFGVLGTDKGGGNEGLTGALQAGQLPEPFNNH